MRLSAPKVVTFWIGVILGLLGFIGSLATIPLISTYAFWFLFVGFVVLAVGVVVKDM